MLRKLPILPLLSWLLFVSLNSAIAQFSADDNIYRLPPTQAEGAFNAPRVDEAEDVGVSGALVPEEFVDSDADSWILPTYWFSPVEWEGGVELGISGTAGNSEAASFRVGTELIRKTEIDEINFDLTYLNASADGVETQNNAIQNLGYERSFGETRWSFFAKEFLEYDEFKAFDLRLALNAGIGFKFIDTDTTTLKGRYGAGVSHEIGGVSDDWVPELVYGADFERQLTKRQKLALTVDYFPEWGQFDNYRVVSDFGWEVLLDEEHNLNLKLSVNDRYDSTPNGRKPNDINYALLLLWKM